VRGIGVGSFEPDVFVLVFGLSGDALFWAARQKQSGLGCAGGVTGDLIGDWSVEGRRRILLSVLHVEWSVARPEIEGLRDRMKTDSVFALAVRSMIPIANV